MTKVLQRVTTEYVPAEDRVRLAGVTDDSRPAIVWLTRRMLVVLLPVLFDRLDAQFATVLPEHREALQEFAQQAARDSLESSEPVQVAQECDVLLPTDANVSNTENGVVVLTFRDQSGGAFTLPLASEVLRQWLQILYRAERKADWQLVWPAWLTGESDPFADLIAAIH